MEKHSVLSKKFTLNIFLTIYSFRDSISDYPSESKGSPDGFGGVTASYKNIRDDEADHVPQNSGEFYL